MDPLQSELDAVRHLLRQQIQELDGAIRLLIDDREMTRRPLPLAHIVLAAAYPVQDGEEDRDRRQFLAAALELLHTALGIHKTLIVADAAALDRNQAGAAILLGDYCFSRAAQLAASTQVPKVVEVFAQALKTVSAGALRRLMPEGSPEAAAGFSEIEELAAAGILAGSYLSGLQEEHRQAMHRYVDCLRLDDSGRFALRAPGDPPPLSDLPAHQLPRWQRLLGMTPLSCN